REVPQFTLGVDRSACVTTLSGPMLRRIALISTLLVLAVAAPAAAQDSPFGPLPDAPTPAPTVSATATPATDSGETGRDTLFIIGGALLIGFAFMGWFI